MPGFDWNGNGRSDAFDHFMDMKVASGKSDDAEGIDIDTEITDELDDDNDEIDYHRAAVASSLRSVYTSTSTSGTKGASFQDELKKNMKSPETVRQENAERERSSAMWEAKRTLDKIKELLLYQVKNAAYETKNGVTSVSCTYGSVNQQYMRKNSYNNNEQLRANQKKFVLLRDPTLVYRTWDVFDINPKHSSEYHSFMTALQELAKKEGITIEPVVLSKLCGVLPFPTTAEKTYGFAQLGLRATSIISVDPNYNPPTTETQTQTPKATEAKTTGAKQDDNATTIVKCVLCVGVCILGFAICLSADIGKLGMGLVMIGAAALGYFIMKK